MTFTFAICRLDRAGRRLAAHRVPVYRPSVFCPGLDIAGPERRHETLGVTVMICGSFVGEKEMEGENKRGGEKIRGGVRK